MVYTYQELSAAQVEENRSVLIELATKSYVHLFEKKLSKKTLQQFKAVIGLRETWDVLFSMSTCFVCYHQQTIVGAVYWVSSGHPWKYFEADWSYIRMLGVDPDYKGQGIGKKLTRLCIEASLQHGEHILALHTSEIQEAARHIYENMGFVQQKELEPIWGKRYWLYSLNIHSSKK